MNMNQIWSSGDTIAAIATPDGTGGIGIVRVSGDNLSNLVYELTDQSLSPHKATRTAFYAADGSVIDDGIALYFAAPQSYTGEDVLELHAHGSPIVLNMLLDRVLELGARMADPGEFTKRAFLNGKMDLLQAESVADLIASSTQSAARAAIASLSGRFSKKIRSFSSSLIKIRTYIEAAIDFSEEEIDYLPLDRLFSHVQILCDDIADTILNARQGVLLREGVRIALIGEPNVGKSSLLNALLGEDRAIVTPVPGTTRDTITERVNIKGIPVLLVDTAGLRETDHPVEQMGIERTWQEINQASVILWMVDDSTPENKAFTEEQLKQLPDNVKRINIHNKIDKSGADPKITVDEDIIDVWVSAKKNIGISLVKRAILHVIGAGRMDETPFIARQRHINALQDAQYHLHVALSQRSNLECVAEELRLAHHALGEIVGEFSSDDLLGSIFSEFCIGK